MSMWSLSRTCLLVLLADLTAVQALHLNATAVATPADPDSAVSTQSRGRNSKVHIESTETGWAEAPPTETPSRDLGSIIASLAEPTPTENSARPSSPFKVHDESSETAFGSQFTRLPQTQALSTAQKANVQLPTLITNNGQTLTPTAPLSVIIGTQTLTPGGETATIGEGDGATKVHVDPSGSPVVVVGDSTTTARLSSAPSQVFTVGQLTATAESGNLQFVVASSTLALGQSITLSGTVIALTTNAAGATVLVSGDSTTTLASPAPSRGADVSTLVADGTTQYIIDSQTLAPDHPITVHGTPISIRTEGSSTILVVGDATTTLTGPTATDFTITSGLSLTTPKTFGGTGGSAAPTTTSKTGAATPSARLSSMGVSLVVLALAVLCFG